MSFVHSDSLIGVSLLNHILLATFLSDQIKQLILRDLLGLQQGCLLELAGASLLPHHHVGRILAHVRHHLRPQVLHQLRHLLPLEALIDACEDKHQTTEAARTSHRNLFAPRIFWPSPVSEHCVGFSPLDLLRLLQGCLLPFVILALFSPLFLDIPPSLVIVRGLRMPWHWRRAGGRLDQPDISLARVVSGRFWRNVPRSWCLPWIDLIATILLH